MPAARDTTKEMIAPLPETVAEYKRVLKLFEDNAPRVGVFAGEEYYGECQVEGVHHPKTMCKLLPALHMLVAGFASQVEIARLLEMRPTVLQQHRFRREERLSLMQVKGKFKYEDMRV